jgi:hypothetical protein
LGRKPGKVQRLAFKGDVLQDNGANGAHGAKKHEAGKIARRGFPNPNPAPYF